MTNYTKRKHFTIHRNDAGTEAYRDEYVRWLEDQVRQMTDAVRRRGFDFVCIGTAAMELTRYFRPNIEYSGDPLFVALEADAGFTELDDHKAAIEEYGKWTCEKSSRTQS